MKILVRNLKASTLSLDFTGYDVTPLGATILQGKSQVVDTSLSVIEFKQIPAVDTELGLSNMSISFRGGVKVIN